MGREQRKSPVNVTEEEEKRALAESKAFVKKYGQYLVHGTFACGIASLIGGAYFAMKRPKKAAEVLVETTKVSKTVNPEDEAAAVRLAFKALLYGSALSVAGFSTVVLGSCWYLGISSVHEVGEKMRVLVPNGKEKLQGAVSPVLELVTSVGQWFGLKTRTLTGVETPDEEAVEAELEQEYNTLPRHDKERLRKIGEAIVKMDE